MKRQCASAGGDDAPKIEGGGDCTRRARARELSTGGPSERKGGWHGNGAGRGGPARGAGRGGPARGRGWGGPATGSHVWPANGPGDPRWPSLTRTQRAELKQRRADALADHLFSLAFHAPDQMTQLRAAAMLHGIYNGLPVSRGLIAGADPNAEMTADDIRAELARLEREKSAC